MRKLGLVSALTIALLVPAGYDAANADHGSVPSKSDVQAARDAVVGQQGRIAQVQSQLAAANQQLQDSARKADAAYEAWNGARYRLQQARQAAKAADHRARIAGGDVERQRAAYASAIVSSYEQSPELAAISAMVQSDGISSVVDQATTMQSTEQAMDGHYDAFRASATLADVAAGQAQDARTAAQRLAVQAKHARDTARAAADAAAAQAQQIAQQKDELIGELAHLQHVSKSLATQRQAALERAAAKAAAEAAQRKAEQQAKREAARAAAQKAAQKAAQQAAQQAQHTTHHATHQATHPVTHTAPAQPSSPPAPAGGASAAIAFARAQIGDPYVWGATGPDSWDCSGLTMGAWSAGGRSLPHYSVAQYEQSTPISSADLQPGDLVFWGSSSDPSSIYHVALYSGGGMIIQAPRTGSNVGEGSMYAWTAPNFFARP